MKRKRHSPEQIIAKLREADAMLAPAPSAGPTRLECTVQKPPRPVSRWRVGPSDVQVAARCGPG